MQLLRAAVLQSFFLCGSSRPVVLRRLQVELLEARLGVCEEGALDAAVLEGAHGDAHQSVGGGVVLPTRQNKGVDRGWGEGAPQACPALWRPPRAQMKPSTAIYRSP